jgi:hypothetical protein
MIPCYVKKEDKDNNENKNKVQLSKSVFNSLIDS